MRPTQPESCKMRGHTPKLDRIMAELKAEGLPDDFRPCELEERIGEKAKELGFLPHETPKRSSIGRWWSKYKAGKMGNTDNATSDAQM
jgi:hypothetical protein